MVINERIIDLAYGHKNRRITVATDRLIGIYRPKRIDNPLGEAEILKNVMAHPIGTPRLREIVRPHQQVVIVVSDISRPCPTDKILPYIVAELEAAGVNNNDVLIVVALGLHRSQTQSEIDNLISPEMANRLRVINHDPEDVIRLGFTSRGTPVEFFRPVVQADIRICLGNLEFHYYAGYSGGAKAILPGVAYRSTPRSKAQTDNIFGVMIDNA